MAFMGVQTTGKCIANDIHGSLKPSVNANMTFKRV